MKLYNKVRTLGVAPELILALLVAESVYQKHGGHAVITCVIEGKHMNGSLHYTGCAVDLAIGINAGVPIASAGPIIKAIKDNLSADYDAILETDHIHIEYQPKASLTEL